MAKTWLKQTPVFDTIVLNTYLVDIITVLFDYSIWIDTVPLVDGWGTAVTLQFSDQWHNVSSAGADRDDYHDLDLVYYIWG